MIASISKGSDYSRLIDYHEKKCIEGKASLLYNGTYSVEDTGSAYKMAMDGHFSLFSKEAMLNKVAHISIALPKGEKLDDEKFREVSQYYIDKMGYKNCPYVIYRHNDKDHDHVHIIAATIDDRGKKIVEYNDFKKSQDLSRKMEVKFNLRTTEYTSDRPKTSLTEINFRKYYLHNAIKKASHDYSAKAHINSFLTDFEKKIIFSKSELTQKQILSVMGEERFNNLYAFLQKKGFFNTLFKDELSNKIDDILNYSTTFKDYVKECNKQGIYVRKMTDKNQKPFLKYGIIENNFYTKDTNLSGRFRWENVKEKFNILEKNNGKSKTQFEQSIYIKDQLFSSLEATGSFEGFATFLSKGGIETIIHENKKGPCDLSFKDLNCDSPVVFNLSYFDKDLTLEKVMSHFDKNDSTINTTYVPAEPMEAPQEILNTPLSTSIPEGQKKRRDDNTNLSGKKKKRKPKNDIGM